MDSDLFVGIFQEIGNLISSVALWNYGEPLMHPDIERLLPAVAHHSCRKKLSTSGSRLDDFPDLRFLGALDELIISMNGLDQETYAEHQAGGDLEKVLRGLERLSEIPTHVELTLQVVANKFNVTQIPKFRRFAREKGFNKLVVKSFNVMDYDLDTLHRFVPANPQYSRYPSGVAVSRPSNLKAVPCKGGMVIAWNGQALPCCFDYRGDCVMGDVSKVGVLGVWNSPEARAVRHSIQGGRLLDICQIDCSSTKVVLSEEF